jgi:hypothetical protein
MRSFVTCSLASQRPSSMELVMVTQGSLLWSYILIMAFHPKSIIRSQNHPKFVLICLKASFHPHLGLPSGLLLSGFPSKTLYAFVTLACVLHDLPTSLSYTLFQILTMSTPKCKIFLRWNANTQKHATKYFVSLDKRTDTRKHETLTVVSLTEGNVSSALCSTILSALVARECRICCHL